MLQDHGLLSRLLDPLSSHGAVLLDKMIGREALIIGYANDYRLMSLMVIPPLLLLLAMKRPGLRAVKS